MYYDDLMITKDMIVQDSMYLCIALYNRVAHTSYSFKLFTKSRKGQSEKQGIVWESEGNHFSPVFLLPLFLSLPFFPSPSPLRFAN